MPQFYDQAQDEQVEAMGRGGWQPTVVERHYAPTAYRPRRSDLNPVTGHGRDCECPSCPGWYEQRTRLANQAPEARSTTPTRQPRPLTDQVVPVAILMMVFTVCCLVLIPVITPMLALGSMSLALMAVSLTVVALVGLSVLRVVRQTPHEVNDVPRKRTIIGQLINRG